MTFAFCTIPAEESSVDFRGSLFQPSSLLSHSQQLVIQMLCGNRKITNAIVSKKLSSSVMKTPAEVMANPNVSKLQR